jgi:hypothetical protein
LREIANYQDWLAVDGVNSNPRYEFETQPAEYFEEFRPVKATEKTPLKTSRYVARTGLDFSREQSVTGATGAIGAIRQGLHRKVGIVNAPDNADPLETLLSLDRPVLVEEWHKVFGHSAPRSAQVRLLRGASLRQAKTTDTDPVLLRFFAF